MFNRVKFERLLLLLLILITLIGLAYYFILGKKIRASVTSRLLNREQIIARAEANNIVTFFQQFGSSVAILSQLRGMDRFDDSTQKDMDVFMEQWQKRDIVGGVVLTDKNGIVRFNSNVKGIRDTGTSLADRDYFRWAKNQSEGGSYFVGNPVISRTGASKGELIVPVVSPVYQNGTFVGVVAASVKLNSLTNRYLSLMMISESTETYLLNHQGELLYRSTEPVMARINIFDSSQDSTFLGSEAVEAKLKIALKEFHEDRFETVYINPVTDYLEARLIAYSPISLSSQNWLVIVTSPLGDYVDFDSPFFLQSED